MDGRASVWDSHPRVADERSQGYHDDRSTAGDMHAA